jgi:hypothetical protein
MDNNIVERAVRPNALNQQNALFAGHDKGGRIWARIASLIETCKFDSVDLMPASRQSSKPSQLAIQARLSTHSYHGTLTNRLEIEMDETEVSEPNCSRRF